MRALAVVLERPQHLHLGDVLLAEPQDDDVVVDVTWSGISTGTERLLYSGQMPSFPRMGYPRNRLSYSTKRGLNIVA